MKVIIRITCCLLLLLCVVSCKGQNAQLVDDEFNQGLVLFDSGKYEQAYSVLIQLAEKGHPGAQNTIGVMYSGGKYVSKNYKTAASWFKKSSDGGDSYGLYNLGNAYFKGHGVGESCSKALSLFIKSADLNNVRSFYILGSLYGKGECVGVDRETSYKYYEKASHYDSEYGLLSKAVILYKGLGGQTQYADAKRIFEKLDDQYGNMYSRFYLAVMYALGQGVAADLDVAYSYYRKALDAGSSESGYRAAYMIYHKEVNRNPKEAYAAAFEAAEGGYPKAQQLLGRFYKEGFGVQKNSDKAKYWYSRAAIK